MKDISKINVRHFLNRNLPFILDNNETAYPLYVKITFKRKSTEIKSSLNIYVKESESDHIDRINDAVYEQHMITHFVTIGYENLGEKFNLRGIANICRSYSGKVISDLMNSFVMNEFDEFFKQSNSEFNSIFINRNNDTNFSTYYQAAIVLFPNNEKLLQMKHKFEIVRDIELLTIEGLGKLREQRIVSWHFGLTKELFMINAQASNMAKERIDEIIFIIETELLKL